MYCNLFINCCMFPISIFDCVPTVPPPVYKYLLSVELNTTLLTAINTMRSILGNISYPLSINGDTQINQANISTVCSPIRDGHQCICEDQYRWSCDQCLMYGACDQISADSCGCINAIPSDRNFLPPPVYKYLLSVELNTTLLTAINTMRSILGNISYPLSINGDTQINQANISTVCSPIRDGYQCICEDQYRWSCDQCLMYGACDQISADSCGCINAIPSDRNFCHSLVQHIPPPVYKYLLSVELNTTLLTAINTMRSILGNISYPLSINGDTQINQANISTVCSPIRDGYQCICEDQYRWSCDQCLMYGACDQISADSCGCINAIPSDRNFCQSLVQHSKNIFDCVPTVPPPVYKYLLSVELNTTLLTAINTMRSILGNISYPLSINGDTQINQANISTVCSPIRDGYQCICEDQYRWSCDQCLMYGACDQISPCGCINAIPPDGHFCQSLDQLNTQTSPTTIFVPTTVFLTTDEPTTAASTLLTTTTGPITTSNPTIIPTTTEKPTTKVVTVTTIKEPTTAISTDIPTTFVPSVPTTAVNPTTTTTTATTTSTVPTKTTKVTNNTTETIGTTTTTKAATTTTTMATTTTTTKATTTTTKKDIPTTEATMIPITKATMTTTTEATMTTTTKATTTTTTKATTTTTIKATTTAETTTIKPTNFTTSLKGSSVISFLFFVCLLFLRPGSVIADFVISTAEDSATQITEANKDLKNTLKSIAPVLKSTAQYKSSTKIKFNSTYLTNTTMTLVCGPPEGDLLDIVGNINSAEWKFENINISPGRRTFTTRSNTSILTVNNVNPFDTGLYECILKGTNSEFYQNGTVEKVNIQAAPDVKVVAVKNVVCKAGNKANLSCCVQPIYTITWAQPPSRTTSSPDEYCINNEYTITSCDDMTFTCKVNEYDGYEKTTTLKFFKGGKSPTCTSDLYGDGQEGFIADVACPEGQKGRKKAICKGNKWELSEENCILTVITDLFELVQENVQTFSSDLQKAVNDSKTVIAKSSKSVSTIVNILTTIANVSTSVTTDVMRNVLQTIDVLADDGVKESWETLNKDRNNNAGSKLLESLETLSGALSGTADISTERIHLIRTNAANFETPNSTFSLKIPDSDGFFDNDTFMTIIILSTFNNVMPARNSSFNLSLFNGTSNETSNPNNANLAINAAVVLVKVNQTVQNVSFEFQTLNETLSQETQCVFWNFTLLENFGAWDDEGCKFVSLKNNDTVTCNCNHLTSFSVLMSTDISLFVNIPTTVPPGLVGLILDIITYIGVGISLASLVICLIIEGYVWKAVTKNSTALMRHISIVNTALSLLIADICFIIAASYSQKALDNKDGDFKVLIGQCSAVTFFMHFFYLSLFFWMLVSGLLLLYRTVMVFSHMSKSIMIAIGFVIGYGCPLIIAVTTVAATAPSQTYIRKNYICWLNWTESKALLSLVIPALVIVVINIIVVIVVLCKMMRRTSANTIQPDEKNSFVVILRCLAILTPLFGLTWALGIGTMVSPKDVGIHIAFAFFNSLQGFFILVFGTLFDSKVGWVRGGHIKTKQIT
uniref:Adhesion G protein-coupled receptor F5 n=1 Tax=Oryzias latipes TaxID=8090 RepID=A0A3B3HSV9_ORYLA